jgi:hypothetical protein
MPPGIGCSTTRSFSNNLLPGQCAAIGDQSQLVPGSGLVY